MHCFPLYTATYLLEWRGGKKELINAFYIHSNDEIAAGGYNKYKTQ